MRSGKRDISPAGVRSQKVPGGQACNMNGQPSCPASSPAGPSRPCWSPALEQQAGESEGQWDTGEEVVLTPSAHGIPHSRCPVSSIWGQTAHSHAGLFDRCQAPRKAPACSPLIEEGWWRAPLDPASLAGPARRMLPAPPLVVLTLGVTSRTSSSHSLP